MSNPEFGKNPNSREASFFPESLESTGRDELEFKVSASLGTIMAKNALGNVLGGTAETTESLVRDLTTGGNSSANPEAPMNQIMTPAEAAVPTVQLAREQVEALYQSQPNQAAQIPGSVEQLQHV